MNPVSSPNIGDIGDIEIEETPSISYIRFSGKRIFEIQDIQLNGTSIYNPDEWTTTPQTTTPTNKYLWNYQEIIYTDGSRQKTEPCIIGTYGDTGETGAQGPQGADGDDGKSAYESAVDGGYSGTESQFNTDLADVSNKAPLTIIREYGSGVLVGKTGNAVGALVNANGSFDVVNTTWSGLTPTAGTVYSSFGGTTARIGQKSSSNTEITANGILNNYNGLPLFEVNTTGVSSYTFSSSHSHTFTTTAIKDDIGYLSYVYTGETFTIKVGTSTTAYSFTKGTAKTITVGTLKFVYNGNITFSVSTTSGTSNDSYVVEGTAHEPTASFSMGTRHGDATRGKTSLAVGYLNTSSGNYSASFGKFTESTGESSFTQGQQTVASGNYSLAQGWKTQASGLQSHAEGNTTYAIGNTSHAEGSNTYANGVGAHAEGYLTHATGNYSHTEGYGTTAGYQYQTVIGQYNSNSSSNIFEVGIGTSASKKNGFAVSTAGAISVAGGGTFGGAISATAISNASTLFAKTNHTFTIASIAKDGTSGATQKTFTKSGYYPVGIVGFQTGGGKVCFARLEITSASSGSATITYNAYNGATTASGSLSASVDILWVKTS